MAMLARLKRLVPASLRGLFHRLVATLAGLWYGHPSRHLVVVGVTGTDGKTTTSSLIADVLAAGGTKVGLSSSAVFQVGERRWLNNTHLTMPGRFALQRLLREMVLAGCRYAVVEVSSEGLAQYRHAGIDFDVAVLTNLTSEHIESHGSFAAYREAKGMLFRSIIRGGDKHFDGRTIPKVTVINLDDPAHDFFLKYWAERHYGTTLLNHDGRTTVGEKLDVVAARDVRLRVQESLFSVDGRRYVIPLAGEYNVHNALQAIAVGRGLGVSDEYIAQGLSRAHAVPGRGEVVDSGRGWRVVVDYALTPNALREFYRSLSANGAKRILAVFGAAGGGRDAWKRPELGMIAAEYCARIILTTDDPYDESPAAIAAAIAAGISANEQAKVEIELDRRVAVRRAMSLAQPGDVVAVTGMGSETSMMVKGKAVPWSDIKVVRQELDRRS